MAFDMTKVNLDYGTSGDKASIPLRETESTAHPSHAPETAARRAPQRPQAA
ncbi:hypothetical protein QTH90_30770 [Variovorax sp. J2P1-59]|uniref:hypothetical protein n=1 Tax=Variovorax flavidus TaxID=3053501 RepID=UPI00257793A7|nr:hypothetical protein [Variovorax sp. J2P1-59]MDM0078825.1 hypothetical protein [Variovorax sp. J2P1-59]